MSLERVNRDILQEGIVMLDQALHNHQQWYNQLTRTLVCRLSPDNHDIAADSCHQCRLGQWYDSIHVEAFKTHPGFIALGRAHQEMHEITRQLLMAMDAGSSIQPLQYDQFVNAREKLQLEIMALRGEIEGLLYHRDPLTGAINRVNMFPYVREQQDMVKRLKYQTCLVMMDLDFFKKVNDQYGHSVGDTVLVTITQYLLTHLRSYDKVFRYGGEEFLICLPSTTLEEGYPMIERIREGISTLTFEASKGVMFSMTSSFGMTLLNPEKPVEHSIECADKALYEAKKNGRNATHVWKVMSL